MWCREYGAGVGCVLWISHLLLVAVIAIADVEDDHESHEGAAALKHLGHELRSPVIEQGAAYALASDGRWQSSGSSLGFGRGAKLLRCELDGWVHA